MLYGAVFGPNALPHSVWCDVNRSLRSGSHVSPSQATISDTTDQLLWDQTAKEFPFTSPAHSLQETERRRNRDVTRPLGDDDSIVICVCVCVVWHWTCKSVSNGSFETLRGKKQKFISFSACWTLYTVTLVCFNTQTKCHECPFITGWQAIYMKICATKTCFFQLLQSFI